MKTRHPEEQKDDPLVAIVILNWNNSTDTCECIESVLNQNYTNYNLIVVDNGSDTNHIEAIKQEHEDDIDKLISLDENLGYSAGNNIGIRYAIRGLSADYVLLLNNDVILKNTTIRELVAGAEKGSADIAGPKTLRKGDKDTIHSLGGKVTKYALHHSIIGEGEQDAGKYEDHIEIDFVSGACMLIRSSIFEDIGLLPTEYFLRWEDIDFCTKARQKGYNIICCTDAVIYHEVHGSVPDRRYNKMMQRAYRNRIWYFKKYTNKYEKILLVMAAPITVLPIYVLYNSIDKGVIYTTHMLKGILMGIVYSVGEGPDPDPELQEEARKSQRTNVEI